MKKNVLYLFVLILTMGAISCSKDDGGDDGDDGSGITGKWYYYQTGTVVNGEEYLIDAVEGCGSDYSYVELKSDGTLKEVWFYADGTGCASETDESGTWSKNGSNFTISYDGDVFMEGEIITFNDSTLKIQFTQSGTTYVAVYKRTLNVDPGDSSEFEGQWDGTFSGDDSGVFSVTINSSGEISGEGYSNNWQESFTLSGSVDSDGSFNAGNASTGATFTGTILGTNLTGNWENPSAGESGTFEGQKLP